MDEHVDATTHHHHSKAHDKRVRQAAQGAVVGAGVGLALLGALFVLMHSGPKETASTAMKMPGASVIASSEAAANR